MVLREALINRETTEVRIAFDLQSGNVVVVKFFSTDGEEATVKWFKGIYSRIRSFWRTLAPFEPDAALVERALAVIADAAADIQPPGPAAVAMEPLPIEVAAPAPAPEAVPLIAPVAPGVPGATSLFLKERTMFA